MECLNPYKSLKLKYAAKRNLLTAFLPIQPNAVLVIDQSQNIVLTNIAFNMMFGVDAGGIKGKNLSSVAALTDLSPEATEFIDSQSPESRTELQYKGNGLRKTLTV